MMSLHRNVTEYFILTIPAHLKMSRKLNLRLCKEQLLVMYNIILLSLVDVVKKKQHKTNIFVVMFAVYNLLCFGNVKVILDTVVQIMCFPGDRSKCVIFQNKIHHGEIMVNRALHTSPYYC